MDKKSVIGNKEIEGKVFETWLCSSEDFKDRGEAKVALDDYYTAQKEANESPLEFCKRMGCHYSILVYHPCFEIE